VSIATPNNLVPVIQSQIAEAMCVPSVESIEGTLGMGSEEELVNVLNRMHACAIGPGLSTHHETVKAVRNLISRLPVPAVIDADGLNALVGFTDILKRAKAPLILTPHPGEMGSWPEFRLTMYKDRITVASAFAGKFNRRLCSKARTRSLQRPRVPYSLIRPGIPVWHPREPEMC
jgi:NAD(P)H-hydrate epimerase